MLKPTSNAICKDSAAINCITVLHKKGSFPSTLTGRATLVDIIKALQVLQINQRSV
jgi:hypothetical protein